MISNLSFFLVAIGVSSILAANVCKTGNIVHRPGNSQSYYFPNNWNENQTAPGLSRDQSCSWVFTVPHGYYAKLIISGNMGDDYSHFQTVDAAGNVVQTQHENKEPYYFPFPKFTLIVNNEAPAKFGFKVVWAPFPNVQKQQGGVNLRPFLINITKDTTSLEFVAVTGISVLAFPADLKNYHALKSALLFDGNDMNAPFVNNLYGLYESGVQFLSTGQTVYIINVEAQNSTDKVLIQESGYTNYLQPYDELICPPSSTCSKSLDGEDKWSGLVYAGNQKQTLMNVQMNKNATFYVFYGTPSQYDLYKSYSGSTINSQLPLTFDAGIVQYIISNGNSAFTFRFSN